MTTTMSRAGGLAPSDALYPALGPLPTPFYRGYATAIPAPDTEVRDLDDPADVVHKQAFRETLAYTTGAVDPFMFEYDRVNMRTWRLPVPANYLGVQAGQHVFPGGGEAASAPGGMLREVTSTQTIPDRLIMRTLPVRFQLH